MTEYEALHRQAESDLALFQLLSDEARDGVPECHPLHSLQMATEKITKAALGAITGRPA
jgi:hypothetical protein